MERALIDTDIFSDILKGRDKAVTAAAKAYRAGHGSFTISAITVMEIVQGLHKKGQASRIKRFLEFVELSEVLEFDLSAALVAGRIVSDLEDAGQPIGRADPMIAAIAIHHELVLITANTAHFRRIQEIGYPLLLDNWREIQLPP